MDRHVLQNLAHMLIGDFVEDLLGVAHALDESSSAQEPQMVADQRERQIQPFRDVTDGNRARRAAQEDLETRRIPQQAEGLRQDGDLVLRQ